MVGCEPTVRGGLLHDSDFLREPDFSGGADHELIIGLNGKIL
jgi:hypothetical protein